MDFCSRILAQGKDITYNALKAAVKQATEYVETKQKQELEERARRLYIRSASKDIPDFDETAVKLEDYQDTIPVPETSVTNLASTRGGISTSLNKMARTNYGVKSLFASELAMAIQGNAGIMEVLELFSVLFDNGASVAPEFKTQESKELDINDAFVNLLGISSPAPFYQQDSNVRKLLVPMMRTALARRITVVFSSAEEEFENMVVPNSPSEKRILKAASRALVHELNDTINSRILSAMTNLVESQDLTVSFDEEASIIYDDYKSYTEELGKSMLLRDENDTIGLETSGRAFKMARIAATWTLAQGMKRIDKQTLIAAIYFSDYTAQHMRRFLDTLEMEPYRILIKDWREGFFGDVLPLHVAITKGYVSTKQVSAHNIESFLKPVNSALVGEATVIYQDNINSFVFTRIVEDKATDNYSYLVERGHINDMPTTTKTNAPITVFSKLIGTDSTINPFVGEHTKFIAIKVKESFLSIDMLHKYLSDTVHFITSHNAENKHDFTIVIPVNIPISKNDYKFVTLSIAEQLMLDVLPEEHESSSIYHGYTEGIQLFSDDSATIFDCAGIIANCASGGEVPRLTTKSKTKPTKAQIDQYVKKDILANKQLIVDMLDASNTKLLLFAGLVYDLHCHYVSDEQIRTIIDSINSELITSISEADKLAYLVEPFKEQ